MDSSAKLALLIFGLQSAQMKIGGTNYRIHIFGEIWREENRFGGDSICARPRRHAFADWWRDDASDCDDSADSVAL